MLNKLRKGVMNDDASSLAASDHSSEAGESDASLQAHAMKKPRTFRITSISCRSLRNVDSSGNDPFVIIEFDGKEVRTEKISNAGANALFENLDLSMTVDKSSIRTKEMIVSVYDHNDVMSHVLIGSGTTTIAELLKYDSLQAVPFNVDLRYTDKKGKTALAGRLELAISLDKKPKGKMLRAVKKISAINAFKSGASSASPKEGTTLSPEDSFVKPRLIRVLSASCHELRSVDISGNDPFIVFDFDGQQMTTHHVANAGARADFGELSLCMLVEKASLREKELTVSVFDYNHMAAHTHIGSGTISIAQLVQCEAGQAVPFSVQLLCADRRKARGLAGRVDFVLLMEPKQSKPLISTKAAASTARKLSDMLAKPMQVVAAAATAAHPVPSILCIERIHCKELSNVEMFGKNDPFVLLQFNTQECRTAHISNAGDKAFFESLGLRFAITEAEIASTDMLVEVYDHNDVLPPVLIGSGTLSMTSLLPYKKSQEQELSVTLVKHSKGKSKVTGKVTVWVRLDSEGVSTSQPAGTSSREASKLAAASVAVAPSHDTNSATGTTASARRKTVMYNPLNAFQPTDSSVEVAEPECVDPVMEKIVNPKTIRFLRLECHNIKAPTTRSEAVAIATISFAGQRMKSACSTIQNGNYVQFDDLDLTMTVEKEALIEENVTLLLHQRVGNTDTLIGSGTSSMEALMQVDKGDVVRVSFELQRKDKKGKMGPGGGTAELYVVRGKAQNQNGTGSSTCCCLVS